MAQEYTTATGEPLPAHVHVLPMRVLVGVWFGLLVLTFVTVAASWVDFGALMGEPWLNLVGALSIAVLKAALVALYFMHLRYDHPFHGFVLITSLAFVALLVFISLQDAVSYQDEVIPGYAPAIEQQVAPE
jgi:cytochrome c oxidase subunit 4